MRKTVFTLAVILLAATAVSQAASTATSDSAYEQFQKPGPQWLGKPFWSWNGKLEKEELFRQIHVLKEMGFGGFFMHSRTGLATEYLGQEWFDLTNQCTDEGQKLGMEAWLYDEDRWPSGTAGGLVTQNPAYRMRFMSLRPVAVEQFKWNADIVAAFACKLDGVRYTDCTRIDKDTPVEQLGGKTVLVFTIEAMQEDSFYNGATYVDTMNLQATQEYIRLTHEQYKARCGDRLGKSILGIFTDEPHRGGVMCGFGFSNPNSRWMTPWTEALPGEFKKRFGYDIIQRLPELFLQKDGQAVSQVKWHYMELTQQMFLDNFARPLYEWCQANGLQFTGHVLHEDSLTAQANMQGSLMRFYEFMHYPGVDVLTEGNRGYWIVKQLSSAARQLGQKWMLSELYGCTGWQMRFEDYKYAGDWQALFGINIRCPHLSWYTMAGEAKRDYPASIFYQSGWWKDWAALETYYGRLGVVLAQGQPVCDVVVINPVESVWAQIHADWAANIVQPRSKALQELEQNYQQLFYWLAESRIDFDYADEEMAGRLYRVAKENNQATLYIGKAAYKVAVVGSMTTIRSSTLRMLEEFMAAGGKVVFAGEAPQYVDALGDNKARALAQKAVQVGFDRDSIVNACRQHIRPVVEVLDNSGKPIADVYTQMRQDDKASYFVLMNMSRDKSYDNAVIRLPAKGYVAEWNCMSGRQHEVSGRSTEGFMEITADIPPIGEKVYVVSGERNASPAKAVATRKSTTPCAGPYTYRLSEDNVCVLDLARFQIDNGDWQPETEVLKIDQAIRDTYKIARRGGSMVQPWYNKKFAPKPVVRGKLKMTFAFEAQSIPSEPVMLCMEQPENFTLMLNGKAVSTASNLGWWVDPAIRKLSIPAGGIVEGKNELTLECGFHEEVQIEALYLLGRFGVRVDGTVRTLTVLPAKLAAGDITQQGLPFYSGSVTYRIPVPTNAAGSNQTLMIELPQLDAACVKVHRSDNAPDMIAWPPYRLDITNPAKDGFVELELVLTRRNTFGPLHQNPLRAGAYGPENWITGGSGWSQNYMLWPTGLLQEPAVIVYTD
ncbi:MAG TPA: glycosyl hydrolase [Anaerohalosphaeraceae bacterium]|nr:glycosyl hydrolase [Anaerohalosphaeraceae bacterium]